MKTRESRAEEGPRRAQVLLRYQQSLLSDRVRNRAFARALRKVVRPGLTVMDLGAGSGLWAVHAARLGARRVVAVEKEPLLVPVIRALARENGVADRVHVVEGDSRRLDLPRDIDVLVSETVGAEGFDEDIVDALGDARRRFLKRGARVVPAALSLMTAPAEDPEGVGVRPRLVADAALRELTVHVPNSVPCPAVRLCGRPARLLRVPLGTTDPAATLTGLSAAFQVRDGRRLGCFALWSELELAEGVRLSTREAASWGLLYFPVEPPGPGRWQGRFEVDLGTGQHRWRVAFRRGRREEIREYGALLAWGALRAASLAR